MIKEGFLLHTAIYHMYFKGAVSRNSAKLVNYKMPLN